MAFTRPKTGDEPGAQYILLLIITGCWRGTPIGHPYHHGGPFRPSDPELLLGLASPGSFPCPEGSPSYNVKFSKRAGDGHLVAFGTEFGQVVVLDTRAEAVVRRDHSGPIGWGQTNRARGITSGGVGTRRRLEREEGGGGRVGYCRSWGVRQPRVVAQYRALVNCIFDLDWTHGDSRIALCCGDSKIRVHDTETHAEVLVLSGHAGSVKTISVNPTENSILLSGSRDGSFALWDTRLPQDQQVVGLHSRVSALEASTFATAPMNRVPTRYLSPVEQVYRANHDVLKANRKRPWSYARREDAKPQPPDWAHGGGDHFFYGLQCQSSVTAVFWMPDGHSFLTAGQDGLVKLWDTRYAARPFQAVRPATADASPSGPLAPRIGTPLSPASPAPLSPSPSSNAYFNGRAVPRSAGGGARIGGGGGRNGRGVTFARVTGGEEIAEETLGEGGDEDGAGDGGRAFGVTSVHACDDGSRIAVCTVKDRVSVYSFRSGGLRRLGTFTGSNNASSYYIKAKLSPDGSMLASGSTNDDVCVWQVDCPGPPVARLKGHMNEVTSVDWCRAEPLKLASCSDDETVRVWTIDPLRVERRSHSRARPSSSSSGNASAAATHSPTPAAGHHVVGGHHSRGDGTGTVAGEASRVAAAVGGGGGGRGGASGDVGERFTPRGKFGLGIACRGESSVWKQPGAVKGGGDDGKASRGAGPAQSQSGTAGLVPMEVCPPQPQPPAAGAAATAVSSVPLGPAGGASGGSSGGGAVFSPRSPNKKSMGGVARAPAPCARAKGAADEASSADAQGVARSPAACRTQQQGESENSPPGATPTPGVGGAANLFPEPVASIASGVDYLDSSDVAGGVVDGPARARRTARRGPLDNLPRGWSSASRPGVMANEKRQRRRQPQEEEEEEEGEEKEKEEGESEGGGPGQLGPKEQQRKKTKIIRKGGSSRGSPLPRNNHTLMAIWSRVQGAPSSEPHGKGALEEKGQ